MATAAPVLTNLTNLDLRQLFFCPDTPSSTLEHLVRALTSLPSLCTLNLSLMHVSAPDLATFLERVPSQVSLPPSLHTMVKLPPVQASAELQQAWVAGLQRCAAMAGRLSGLRWPLRLWQEGERSLPWEGALPEFLWSDRVLAGEWGRFCAAVEDRGVKLEPPGAEYERDEADRRARAGKYRGIRPDWWWMVS